MLACRVLRAVLADLHVGQVPGDLDRFLATVAGLERRGAGEVVFLGDLFRALVGFSRFWDATVRRVEEKIAVPLDHDHADAGAAKGGKLFEAAAHGRIPEARKADEGAKEVAQENDLPCAAPLEPGDGREKPVQVAGDLPDVEIGEYGAQHAAC